jgi:hypothetical protein
MSSTNRGSTVTVEARAKVRAPADRVYGLIADYRLGHPRIVPPKYFQNIVVEHGGTGAGTVISFEMKMLGRVRKSRARITEPEPGRVLVEKVDDQAIVTTYRVEPLGAFRTEVTISTVLPTHRGPVGALEGLLVRALLAPVYRDELALIDRVAASDNRQQPLTIAR